jgi:hypothetical protein
MNEIKLPKRSWVSAFAGMTVVLLRQCHGGFNGSLQHMLGTSLLVFDNAKAL